MHEMDRVRSQTSSAAAKHLGGVKTPDMGASCCDNVGMSWVANLILVVSQMEETSNVESFSDWLRNDAPWNGESIPPNAKGVGYLGDLGAGSGWGGFKNPEVRAYGAALNHADTAAVVEQFAETGWVHPQVAQLLLCDQEQDYFRLWMLSDGKPVLLSPEPDHGEDDLDVGYTLRRWRAVRRMLTLDPANSPLLIEDLRPHWRQPAADVVFAGEGWRPIIEKCHLAIKREFPDYELLSIKQREGILAYQAFPRANGAESERLGRLEEVIEPFLVLSETTCEYCGARGTLR